MREIAHAAVVARERLKTGSVADAAEVIDAGLTRAFPLIFIADDETMPANPDSVIEWFARNYSAVAAGQP
jgi:hypothetical protein